ncbi:hypothetical protein [Salmonella phage SD-2_S15]|nr:hypothetical protein [Salmonella phage SD-2_S15]
MKCYWTVQVMCGVLDIILVDSIDALYCTDGMMHIKTADGSLYAYGRNMNANAGVTGVSGVISVATKVLLLL